jgi:three-Cys-motif partner protein
VGNLSGEDLYLGREQTLVKHLILSKYLERFAHKVGAKWDCITYVDCFAGPWNVQSSDLRDSSFSIAIHELQRARETHRKRGRDLRLRCLFLEKDPSAYEQLRKYALEVSRDSGIEIATRNAEFRDSIKDILMFVRDGGSQSFPFVFIDPTGWSGYAMTTIAPLLKLQPVEVLINFMTGHIRRFLDSPVENTRESFAALFGSANYRTRLEGLTGADLDDEAVILYSENVMAVGGFTFVSRATVLHPEINRTQFNLVYATRHPTGVTVFKESEAKAMETMEIARARAGQRKREQRMKQRELLNASDLHNASYYLSLRQRYADIAQRAVEQTLMDHGKVPYDDIWALALSNPLVWERDLKQWIADWGKAGSLRMEGLKVGQRVPQHGKKIVIVWRSDQNK